MANPYSTQIRVKSQLTMARLGQGEVGRAQEVVNRMTPEELEDFLALLDQATDLVVETTREVPVTQP